MFAGHEAVQDVWCVRMAMLPISPMDPLLYHRCSERGMYKFTYMPYWHCIKIDTFIINWRWQQATNIERINLQQWSRNRGGEGEGGWPANKIGLPSPIIRLHFCSIYYTISCWWWSYLRLEAVPIWAHSVLHYIRPYLLNVLLLELAQSQSRPGWLVKFFYKVAWPTQISDLSSLNLDNKLPTVSSWMSSHNYIMLFRLTPPNTPCPPPQYKIGSYSTVQRGHCSHRNQS